MIVTLVVAVLTIAALVALVVVRPRLEKGEELHDAPGIRSMLVVRVGGVRWDEEDGDPSVPPAALLASIGGALDSAGADASSWLTVGSVVELHGTMGAETFRLTLGPLEDDTFLVVVHARTLGRARWVAPPGTDAMRTVLSAVDRGARATPVVVGVAWRRRRDDAARDQPAPTPFD